MPNELTTRFPWEPAPIADTIAAMQRDLAYMVTHTAVMVRSNQAALSMCVNTLRGQIVPRGVCTFTDGSTVEFQDVGMPQPNTSEMSVRDLMARVWDVAKDLGLDIA